MVDNTFFYQTIPFLPRRPEDCIKVIAIPKFNKQRVYVQVWFNLVPIFWKDVVLMKFLCICS